MSQTGDVVTKSMKEREKRGGWGVGEGGDTREGDDNATEFSIDTVFPTTLQIFQTLLTYLCSAPGSFLL